ncbi:ABC transporter permease [Chloroflexi bacterium TSY]|nr:ABC transporter permease [Chloroflexi bacterium TSY]
MNTLIERSTIEGSTIEANTVTTNNAVSEAKTIQHHSANAGKNVIQSSLRTLLPPLILGLLMLGLWYFVSYGLLDEQRRFLLRPPHEVWAVGFANWANFSEILAGLWSSTKVALMGLSLAIAIGFSLATLMSQSLLIERAVFPYAVTLQSIPILAIVPLIGFWFGFGVTARVIVCVLIALFPIIVNTLFGLLAAPRGLHDLFTLQQVDRMTRLRKLMFPAALPAIFAGLRISAGLSVIGAIVGDFFFGRGDPGIGQLLQLYANRLMGEQLIAAIIMSSVLGVAVFQLFGWIQAWTIGAWHEER